MTNTKKIHDLNTDEDDDEDGNCNYLCNGDNGNDSWVDYNEWANLLDELLNDEVGQQSEEENQANSCGGPIAYVDEQECSCHDFLYGFFLGSISSDSNLFVSPFFPSFLRCK